MAGRSSRAQHSRDIQGEVTKPNGLVISSGVRNALTFVLGISAISDFLLATGVWDYERISDNWDALFSAANIGLPLFGIAFLWLIYDAVGE